LDIRYVPAGNISARDFVYERIRVHTPILLMTFVAAGALLGTKISAQSARDIRGASPLVAI
jgi:Family of unknown function (DUF6130)